jgi:hypothetical protein
MLFPRDASSINLPPSNALRPFSDAIIPPNLERPDPGTIPPGGELCRDRWLQKVCRTPKKSPLWYIGGVPKAHLSSLQRTNIAIQMTKEKWRDPAGGSRYDGKEPRS